jgi:hypothetical protein
VALFLPSSSSITVEPVGFPTVSTAFCFGASLVSARRDTRTDVARGLWQRKGDLWGRNGQLNLAYNCYFHGNCKNILHAAKLRHGTDYFTSPPKEGFDPRTVQPVDSRYTYWATEKGKLFSPNRHRNYDFTAHHEKGGPCWEVRSCHQSSTNQSTTDST